MTIELLLEGLFVLWGVVTAVLVVLFIRRSMLTMKEEDQLFLDKAEDHIRKEQVEIVARINKLDKWIWTVGITSAAILLVLAGVWVYHGLTRQFI